MGEKIHFLAIIAAAVLAIGCGKDEKKDDGPETNDSDTGTETDSDSGTDPETDTETDTGTDTESSVKCDLSTKSLAQLASVRCISFPEEVVLSGGDVLVVAPILPTELQSCFPDFPDLTDTNWRGGGVYFKGEKVHYVNSLANLFHITGGSPIIDGDEVFAIHDGRCENGSGYEGSQAGAVSSSKIVDGPTYAVPGPESYNIKRVLTPGPAALPGSWNVVAQGAAGKKVPSPGKAFQGERFGDGTPIITEINGGDEAACQFIEISCFEARSDADTDADTDTETDTDADSDTDDDTDTDDRTDVGAIYQGDPYLDRIVFHADHGTLGPGEATAIVLNQGQSDGYWELIDSFLEPVRERFEDVLPRTGAISPERTYMYTFEWFSTNHFSSAGTVHLISDKGAFEARMHYPTGTLAYTRNDSSSSPASALVAVTGWDDIESESTPPEPQFVVPLPTGDLFGFTFSPDGALAYAVGGSVALQEVLVYEIALSGADAGSITDQTDAIGNSGRNIDITGDGNYLAVPMPNEDEIAIVDVSTMAEAGTAIEVGFTDEPWGVVADDDLFYVSLLREDQIVIVDPSTQSIVGTVEMPSGCGPANLTVDPMGSGRLFIFCLYTGQMRAMMTI